jgi:hypothetical protein
MDRAAAKELLHIEGWLDRSAQIVERGKDAYLADDLLQEAGDSLMMKLGEAANRLSRLDVLAPTASNGHWPSPPELHHPPVRPDQP